MKKKIKRNLSNSNDLSSDIDYKDEEYIPESNNIDEYDEPIHISNTIINKNKKLKEESEDEVGNTINPMLASEYNGFQNIDHWFMSEKLDGVRCLWNGKTLRSRYGNTFHPPGYFIKDFPPFAIDGELYLARNSFSETVSVVKRKVPNEGWKNIKFIIFDAPEKHGTFRQRLHFLEKELIKYKSPYLQLLNHEICRNKEQLENKFKEITELGAEGLILRDPNSKYEHRRSKTMLKVKRFKDAEATVIGISKGTGRLSHLMGSVKVKNKDGKIFKIGSGFNDQERANPPKVGTVITYKYFELSKDGIPRFPTFLRVFEKV